MLYVRIAIELLLAVVIVLAIIGIVWTIRRRQGHRQTQLPTPDEQLANFDALLREHESMRERMRPPPPET